MSLGFEEILNLLEERAGILQKAQINLKKCPKQRLTKGYIETRVKSIEEDWQSFKSYHQALVKCTPKEKRGEIPYFLNETYYTIEDLYLCITGDLNDMLMTFRIIKDTSELTEAKIIPHVKLPNINLPTFTGQYEEWPTFNDLFTSLVHCNTTLTKAQKLHYLKSSVAGEAEVLLRHIKVTDNSYEQAWEVLKQRYGSKRLIVNSILKRFFGQRKITSPTANQIKSLLDTTTECLNSLNNLEVPTVSWDPMIIYIIIQRLDIETHKAWEDYVYSPDSEKLPTWQELKNFLEAKFRTLELLTPTSSTRENRTITFKEKSFHVSAPATTKACNMCQELHTLCHCKEFTKLNPMERSEIVREKQLCYNCLIPGHSALKCRLKMSCRICNRRHHTLLHQKNYMNQSDNIQTHHSQMQDTIEGENSQDIQQDVAISSHIVTKKSTALLATALIPVRDREGHITILRGLIDQGSQASFISERATQLLKLKKKPVRGTVTGVGSTQTEVKHVTQIQLLSRYEKMFQLTVNTYVMSTHLTTKLPSKSFVYPKHSWSHLNNLFLADPSFNQPGTIDLLLGVDVYTQIIKNNLIKGLPGSPCAQETTFGWILFGEIQANNIEEPIIAMHHNVDIEDLLYKLWELDDDKKKILTKEEERCQSLYEETTRRNENGRYIVKLPFKTYPPAAIDGNTREIAKKRLLQLEKRLEKNNDLRIEYNKVMEDYLTLQHMEEIPEEEKEKRSIYLSHHAVVKESSDTTKTRVVFNASALGTNNKSLNDDLMIGPQLQEDLRSLFIRWRLRRIGFVSDIQKMYRQILVTKEDADYQRLLWRANPNLPIKHYRLLRLTFGTASAPYLAVKTLQQTALDEGKEHHKEAEIICTDFFMDDLMSGQDNEDTAIEVAQNISSILKRGGFILQKWYSNSTKFQKEFIEIDKSPSRIDKDTSKVVRTLGLSWDLNEDQLQYHTTLPALSDVVTKRNVLAEIQRVFDRLGWITPTLLTAKLLLQQLWLERISWDEELLPERKEQWLEIINSLKDLHNIKIKRWLHTTNENLPDVTVHGFCDASTVAYGAVAYIRVKTEDGQYKTELIAARSRVAPVKPQSLPRLELCGAVLLSKLLKQISESTRIPKTRIYAWTDSTIVLSWLRADPAKWKTFVRNRVVTILDNIGNEWYNVRSHENPADIASRGMMLVDLKNCDLWWHGPHWLKNDEILMHSPDELEDTVEDLKKEKNINVNIKVTETETKEKTLLTQFDEFDSLTELLKTITYCKRFIHFKKITQIKNTFSTEELSEALEDCVRIVQKYEFKDEIDTLNQRKQLKSRSSLLKLNPFIDEKNILRVGGRLRHADVPENVKHPIILSNKSPLAALIVKDAHQRTLHGGVQLTMNYVSSRFWVIRLKNLVNITVNKCFVCARQKAVSRNQIMGNLPAARVRPARPFSNAGVDFAGPLQILRSKGRGSKTEKGYICIFVCLATKAIHLELVGDLSTDAFLGAFKRFVAKRGRCSHIWSDRGTNFIGASKELQNMWGDTKLQMPANLINLLAEDGTQWHFNPPYSPNFGGLWEAGVKSVKHHLKRIVTTHLTFEEMTTALHQIEACLNSRPLCPIDNSNADNLNVLTPGHFLIGEAPINVPEPDLRDVNWNSLSRWQHQQRVVQSFWHKWQNEYLTRLQQRPKWLKVKTEFEVGEVVLVKTENLPPCKWLLGRIVEKHPGTDNICRVYSLKCAGKLIKRPVNKLCALPFNN